MTQSIIIDFHTHAFPDSLAPRAIAQLTINAAASGYTPLPDGTVDGLIASMDTAGVTRSVVCNIATNAHQMTKVNDFALSCTRNPRLIPLGSLHPDADGAAMDASPPQASRASRSIPTTSIPRSTPPTSSPSWPVARPAVCWWSPTQALIPWPPTTSIVPPI